MNATQQTAPDELTDVEGLYALAAQSLPFAPSHDIRAYLLHRDRGNLLIYSTAGVSAFTPTVTRLGGIARHYLNHSHEALFASERVGLAVFVHEADRTSVAARYRIRGTFSRRHMLDEDFEVIPTPGHTPGATAYLWNSGAHRVLFTGDTIYSRTASGSQRCSRRAIGRPTSAAWSRSESWTSTSSCRGRPPEGRSPTRSPIATMQSAASTRSPSVCAVAKTTDTATRHVRR